MLPVVRKPAALFGLALACLPCACGRPGTPKPAAPVGNFVYVISPDASLVSISATSLSVVNRTDLHDAELFEADRVTSDSAKGDILLQSSRAWSPDAMNPTPGIAVLRPRTDQPSAL